MEEKKLKRWLSNTVHSRYLMVCYLAKFHKRMVEQWGVFCEFRGYWHFQDSCIFVISNTTLNWIRINQQATSSSGVLHMGNTSDRSFHNFCQQEADCLCITIPRPEGQVHRCNVHTMVRDGNWEWCMPPHHSRCCQLASTRYAKLTIWAWS